MKDFVADRRAPAHSAKRQVLGRVAWVALGALMLASAATAADGPGASQCSARQIQAAGKKALGLLGCVAKATRKGAHVDPACTAKVRTKFDTSFTKATAEGDCDTTLTHDDLEAKVDDFVLMVQLAAAPVFVAELTGADEVPASGSPGSGNAIVTVDAVGHTLSVSATFSDLTSATTAAHIHCCAPAGTSIGVATPVPSFPGFPAGVTSGSYTQTFDLTQASSYNPAFVTASGGTAAGAEAALLQGISNGQAYFNIHTSTFPGGEIRGQL